MSKEFWNGVAESLIREAVKPLVFGVLPSGVLVAALTSLWKSLHWYEVVGAGCSFFALWATVVTGILFLKRAKGRVRLTCKIDRGSVGISDSGHVNRSALATNSGMFQAWLVRVSNHPDAYSLTTPTSAKNLSADLTFERDGNEVAHVRIGTWVGTWHPNIELPVTATVDLVLAIHQADEWVCIEECAVYHRLGPEALTARLLLLTPDGAVNQCRTFLIPSLADALFTNC